MRDIVKQIIFGSIWYILRLHLPPSIHQSLELEILWMHYLHIEFQIVSANSVRTLPNSISGNKSYSIAIYSRYIDIMCVYLLIYNVEGLITATSTTGQIFLLALVSEISVLSSIISTLFCLLELVDPLPKLDLLVSIGVTLMYKSLFLCLFFQIWRELVDPPWSFNWTNVSWINHPRWNNSEEGRNWSCWGEDEAAVELL